MLLQRSDGLKHRLLLLEHGLFSHELRLYCLTLLGRLLLVLISKAKDVQVGILLLLAFRRLTYVDGHSLVLFQAGWIRERDRYIELLRLQARRLLQSVNVIGGVAPATR